VVHKRSFNQEVKSCQAPPRFGRRAWTDGPGDLPSFLWFARRDLLVVPVETACSPGIRGTESRQTPKASQAAEKQINICFFEEISSIDLLMRPAAPD
jgi:hypothetical protein